MNYIPGFTNYLQASVPRYAVGGRVNYAEPEMYEGDMYNMGASYAEPYVAPAATTSAPPIMETAQQPAVMPMTTEAAPVDYGALAGLDLSGLNNLYGMNFATDFGGGAMGGIYPDDPNTEYIAAPLSNKGNFTAQSGNAFVMGADQPVRLVDLNTNTVIFEGTGYDAAREATRLGQNLSDTMGRKASYDIQTADPSGVYSTVANEKKNKSTLGEIANVAGTLAPLALMAIPGFGQLGLAAQIAAGAGAGGVGAALKGDNILKGAVMGGLSSAGGQLLGGPLSKIGASNIGLRAGTAIGTGIGSTAGGLVTGQSLKNSLIGGALSGGLSYLSPDITKALKGGAPASTSTSTSGGAPSGGDIVVTAAPAVTPIKLNTSLGGSPNKIQQALAEKPYDGLTVTGDRIGDAFGVNLGGNPFGAPGQDTSAFEKMYTDPANPNDIVVDATTGTTPVSVPVTGPLTTTAPAVLPNDIVVDATTGTTPVSVPVTGPLTTTAPAVLPNDIVVDATKVDKTTPVSVPVTGALPTDIVVDATKLDEVPSVAVPGDFSNITDADKAVVTEAEKPPEKDLGVKDYLEIASLLAGLIPGGKGGSGSPGTYTRGGGGLNPIFSAKLPTANIPGGVGAASNLGARQMGDVDWLTYGQRPELSFYNYVPKPIGMFEGGALPASGEGPSRRTEFAVNGPGTGRSDDIPAVLSDGEYVMDAETVALLGDGSNKAGAKKLDELRVKVRKHKGKKLAKGRFSANAKKPEAYLSGGRV